MADKRMFSKTIIESDLISEYDAENTNALHTLVYARR